MAQKKLTLKELETRQDKFERMVLTKWKDDSDYQDMINNAKAGRSQLNKAHDRITVIENRLKGLELMFLVAFGLLILPISLAVVLLL